MKKWPRFLKNKFSITLLIFLVWMSYFDGNSLARQFHLHRQKSEMQLTVNEKKKEIESVKASLKMFKDKVSRERFAREIYRFKKPGEEIYVIVEKE